MYQKFEDICGYRLPTNMQNFKQKNLTEVKIFQKVLGGYYFLKHPVGTLFGAIEYIACVPRWRINFFILVFTKFRAENLRGHGLLSGK